jgi:hypothetical protein
MSRGVARHVAACGADALPGMRPATGGAGGQGAGRWSKAVPPLEEARAKMAASRGADHYLTLGTTNTLADAYRVSDQLDKAVPLFEQLTETRKAKFGPNHLCTLTAGNNLALAYLVAGRRDRALPLFEQAQDRRTALRRLLQITYRVA